MSKVSIFSQSCKGVEDCGICKYVCPKDLFHSSKEMNEAGYFPPEIEDESECTACRKCMIYCPDFAINVEKPTEPSPDHLENRDAE